MRVEQARKLLELEQDVKRLRKALVRAEGRRNTLRERLLPDLVNAIGFTTAGGVEIKVTERRQRQLFDFSGYVEKYGITKRMQQFTKLGARGYTWTVRHAGDES